MVARCGLELLPEFYAHLNPMPFEAAAKMEVDLAEDLRGAGEVGIEIARQWNSANLRQP